MSALWRLDRALRPAGHAFYLDPPCEGSEDDYGKGVLGPADFEALAEQLAGIRGRFVLSINDTKPVRAAFEGFSMTPVKTTYTIAKGSAAPARELIVTSPASAE